MIPPSGPATTERALRVLLLNHADVGVGGAAVAGFRLHRSLLAAGVDSTLMVGAKASSEATVTTLAHPRLVRRPLRKLGHELGLNELDGLGAFGLSRSPLVEAADVVHAHAVHGGWFSYPAMVPLSRRTPTVLTLHDMWPFTGHCSFSFECERWRSGCGSCPHPEVFPAVRRDATAVEWRLKKAVWARSRLVVVSPSRWLADLAEASVLGRFEVRVIPYGIDTDDFSCRPREASRAALGIAPDRTALLFTAASLRGAESGDPVDRKGVGLLLAALAAVPPALRATCTLLLMGGRGETMATALRAEGYEVVDVGYVVSDPLKSFVYSAADLFVCPTRADNSPLVVLESLACGTPVASFAVGGLGEVIIPGQTGTLAPAEDVAGLTRDLVALLEEPWRLEAMRPACRDLIVTRHPAALAAARHIELYREMAG
ncbi:MAG: glycosyltransferase [Acidimicrobiales bacterium]